MGFFEDYSTDNTTDGFEGLKFTRQTTGSYKDVKSMKPEPVDYIVV